MTSVRRQLESVIAEHGQARLLVEYGDIDFSQIEPRALWEDLKTAGLLPNVKTIAVVSDARWVQKLTSVTGTLSPADVKAFDTSERTAALAWVRA